MNKTVEAGTAVKYHGSQVEFHDTAFVVGGEMPHHPGRYILRQPDGTAPELLLVRRESFTPVGE